MTALSWSKNDQIAFSYKFNPGIFILDLKTSKATHLERGLSPCWSPDTYQIAFSHPSALFVINADRSELRFLNSSFGGDLDWSSDGKRIVFHGCDDLKTFIDFVWLLDLTSHTLQKLTPGKYPCWSPNGKTIAFTSEGGIYLLEVGNLEHSIPLIDRFALRGFHLASDIHNLSWSPKGDELMYNTSYGEIYVVNTARKTVRRVRDCRAWSASWSPTGEKIAFIGSALGDAKYPGGLYTAQWDGTAISKQLLLSDF